MDSLLDHARKAEDTAAGLCKFLDEVPQSATDITAIMSELFAISSGLRTLHNGLDYSRYGRYSTRIVEDLNLVLLSIQYTLASVKKSFGQTRFKDSKGVPPYKTILEDLQASCLDEGSSLCERLEIYRVFIIGLFDVLRGELPSNDMNLLGKELARLLENQERIEPGTLRREPRKPSRPQMHQYPTYPTFPINPMHSPLAPSYDPWDQYAPPHAPEAPISPTFSSSSSLTFSSNQTFSTASSSITRVPHWARKVFDGRHSATPFRSAGSTTRALGRDEPGAEDRLLADEFQQVIEMHTLLRSGNNDKDHFRRKLQFCIPLTALKVQREGACLKLCRVNRDSGKLDLWANLKFPLYERMVLFYSAFIAMKHQDLAPVATGLEDWFQQGEREMEQEEFGGKIEDDDLLLAFRIWRDRDSGCVRFETTPFRGRMKKIPIWTAFVTQYIGIRSWIERVDSKRVQLRELHPYIFCDNYKPPRNISGFFELNFKTRDDADGFVDTFRSFRRK
ncbi:hypothetical protein M501DRAFT_1012628 [Patellaria atrata CBS 101060]|uniref:Uncharacterized protein n=1 Tax=Patellaria atrata CBS 101060 TaxID=1346257 RepID=A0A9P4SHX6_9PEZI|nr:hypothetical protein M501DRAFT_1012628 [Patellaria atrata CBS 101060]